MKKIVLFTLLIFFINLCFAYGDGIYGDGIYSGEYCGDGTCNNEEDCSNCPEDCGICASGSSESGSSGGYVACPSGRIYFNGSCIFPEYPDLQIENNSVEDSETDLDELLEEDLYVNILTGEIIGQFEKNNYGFVILCGTVVLVAFYLIYLFIKIIRKFLTNN